MTTLVHLQAGHIYPLKLEYFHDSWESSIHLLWVPPNLQQEAVEAARKSDVVVAAVGINAQLEGEESESSDPGFFGGDRTDITLPVTQEQLLQAVAATGKPLIVVLTSGSAVAINWANDHAAAILQAWYPGEEGGTAVANVLAGAYNPAGRLPVTFYKSVAQLPPYTDYNMSNRTYRYLTEAPLYPFGFGLSYSSSPTPIRKWNHCSPEPTRTGKSLPTSQTLLILPVTKSSNSTSPIPTSKALPSVPSRVSNESTSSRTPPKTSPSRYPNATSPSSTPPATASSPPAPSTSS